jgi:hypothetical protein
MQHVMIVKLPFAGGSLAQMNSHQYLHLTFSIHGLGFILLTLPRASVPHLWRDS